ncbi:DUF4062 domain-containing protein [Lichenicola cladoniae]|uniref:DUF4062 domain-containing protein n=1 Tax=Lichenicola cladoniae TaxID=1484109 RepID=A0A6M8HSF7_9PROT|nr:DUF4062 domain-containing protein [Lichenicola cladoniae]NPD65523.1 DUF4062 domain-containing protein [Acetobacteraceae bacterium]QKE91423.1 DUF4062 domain-containing protein [Lichenicola cladoniae]
MPAKIRVFVSSTMDDLANEREAVVEVIKSLNFEPVNTEGILPNGGTSWDVLEPEIRTSLICILIQGERYGWIPMGGYGADKGKSVTHLEIDVAQDQGIPILPFFKKLKYGADSTSDDAILRDKFRKEIADWKSGLFRTEFNLASDLRGKVFQALLDVFTSSYLRTAVETQVSKIAAQSPVELTSASRAPPTPPRDAAAPPEVLFAGAGLSLSAGYPSANALAGVVGQALGLDSDQTSRHSLAQLFEVAETTLGRARSLSIVGELLNPPLPVEPTLAHVAAVQRFPIILTTNYDRLFEHACEMLAIPYAVRTPGDYVKGDAKPAVTIFKIDGSMDRPTTLVLSTADADRARMDRLFWVAVEDVLKTSRPIVIGHSMRDANSLSLMNGRNRKIKGIYVAPTIDPIDGRLLLERLNLEGVECSASDYLWKTPP